VDLGDVRMVHGNEMDNSPECLDPVLERADDAADGARLEWTDDVPDGARLELADDAALDGAHIELAEDATDGAQTE
jgi:hypothetical protein